MHDRDINYLLKRYYAPDGFTEKKRAGEIWSKEHSAQAKRDERTFARWDLLEKIITQRMTISKGNFRFTQMDKSRARYLIKNINFNRGPISTEKTIVMIIIYVKLERDPNQKLKDYYPILNDYDIPLQTFVNFLIYLNKFHIDKIPTEQSP